MKRALLFPRLSVLTASLLVLLPARVLARPDEPAPGSTLARIKKQGFLRWGADPNGGAPFCFVDPRDPNRVVGFEVELMDRLADHLGVRPRLEHADWEALPDNLLANRIDLILNGLEVTPSRAKKVAFSVPYFEFVQQLTVRAGDQIRFTSLADLRGRKIAVLNGSASVGVLQENGWIDDQIVQFDDSLKPYEALKDRRVDAVLCESIIARYYAGFDPLLHNLPETFAPGTYAIALRPADKDLLAEVNRILDDMKKSGELGELYQRWGIWSERQQELGIVKGGPQEEILLARPIRLTTSDGFGVGQIVAALLQGAGITLLLTVISMPLALAFGLLLALMGRSGNALLKVPAQVYIQVMRGTPLLVQIYVIFFALPRLGELLHLGELLTWPAIAVGILCLSANYAAYEAEIHRAGLEAVPKGQREAALALGMSESQAFFYVVLPQSFRIILPPVFNDLISMLKDSCLVSVVGVAELLYVASTTGKATFLYGPMLLAAAVLYLILSLAADWFGKRLERWLKHKGLPQVSLQTAHH